MPEMRTHLSSWTITAASRGSRSLSEEEQQSSVPATLKKKKKKARKQLGFWERTVRDTSLFLLIPCGLCCPLPALILGIIGMVTFTDPDAQENAKILTICAGIGIAIGAVLSLIGMLIHKGH
jgi:hypothetical protein